MNPLLSDDATETLRTDPVMATLLDRHDHIRNAGCAFQEHDFSREGLADHSNEQIIDRLTEINGIGAWTARMYLLFVLDRQDVLPLGDLAVRRSIQDLYGEGEDLTRAEMRSIADAWRPYRSIATLYLWAEYESAD